MKKLWFLLFLLVASCHAQMISGPHRSLFTVPVTPTFGTVDLWTPFAGQTAGTALSTSILASGSYPASGSPCTWTTTGTGLAVGASQGPLGGSVDVGASSYPASTSTLSLSVPDSGSIATAICTLNTTSKYITAFSYVTNNGAVAPTGKSLFDRMVSTDANGMYVAAQVQDGQWRFPSGGYDWDIETQPGYTTTHSTGFLPAVVGQRYGVSTCWNSGTGAASMYIYVPLADGNLGLVGSLTANYPTAPNATIQAYRIGNNEGGVSATPSFVQDSMFQVTSPVCPLAPQTVETIPTYVAGAASDGSGTTATLSYTPQKAGDAEVVFACSYSTTQTSITLASTTNTWTQISPTTTTSVGGSSASCAAFSSFGVSASADTITGTYSTSGSYLTLQIVELANVTAVDQNTGFETATTTSTGELSTTSVTPTATNEVAIAFGICNNFCYGGPGFSTIAQDSVLQAATTVGLLTAKGATTGNVIDSGASSGVTDTVDLVTVK